jgi:hypothetical protein
MNNEFSLYVLNQSISSDIFNQLFHVNRQVIIKHTNYDVIQLVGLLHELIHQILPISTTYPHEKLIIISNDVFQNKLLHFYIIENDNIIYNTEDIEGNIGKEVDQMINCFCKQLINYMGENQIIISNDNIDFTLTTYGDQIIEDNYDDYLEIIDKKYIDTFNDFAKYFKQIKYFNFTPFDICECMNENTDFIIKTIGTLKKVINREKI